MRDFSSLRKVPLVSLHSAGFYSYFRIEQPVCMPIVETHPDAEAVADLRVLQPWTELVAFSRQLTEGLEEVDAHDHGHIPYIALLLHYLEVWKSSHGGAAPTSYADKTAFRKLLASGARMDGPEGGEENFVEAVAAVLKALSLPRLDSSVKDVFDYVPKSVRAPKFNRIRLTCYRTRLVSPSGSLPTLYGSFTRHTVSCLFRAQSQT